MAEIDIFENFECKDDFWIKIVQNNKSKLLDILSDDNLSKKEKQSAVKKQISGDKCFGAFVDLLLGYKVDVAKLFPETLEEKYEISFSAEDADEKIADSGECAEFLSSTQNLYSQLEYRSLMSGKEYLSDVMIERYERYREQLRALKEVFSAIFPKQNGRQHAEYRKFFRDLKELDNYARYTYSATSCNVDKFVKKIQEIIVKNEEKLLTFAGEVGAETVAQKAKKILIWLGALSENKKTGHLPFDTVAIFDPNFNVKKEAELGFLQKPRLAGNGIFPKQAHEKELSKILYNQSQYYPLLAEQKNQILDLFNFKIDYFVGPLGANKTGNRAGFGWLVRNEGFEDKNINVFNYREAVNFEATRKQFIERMTGNCTYLIGEKALPKNSMLYCYFNVLNEIGNLSVSIGGKPFEKLGKLCDLSGIDYYSHIIERLLKANTFKQKDLENIFENMYPGCEIMIKGFANGEKLISNLKPIRDMARIFECDGLSANTVMEFLRSEQASMCETIIRDITILGESKAAMANYLKKEYPALTAQQIKSLISLSYSGWGNLSRKLIFGLKSKDASEHLTILELMEKYRKNFISTYSRKVYCFEEYVAQELADCQLTLNEKIDNLVCAPNVKLGIGQAVKVVQEITKIMGHDPQNVFLEFAREKDKRGLKKSRQKQLRAIYDIAEKEAADLYKYWVLGNDGVDLGYLNDDKQANKFQNDMMVLYYLQAGKCMYTGNKIDVNHLSAYDIDHIVPRSLHPDDSFDNRVLVERQANNDKKNFETVPPKLRKETLWRALLQMGMLTKEKFAKLMKKELSEKDKKGFVKKQMVETRQIIKNTAILLDSYFQERANGGKTKVYAIRANLNSAFRNTWTYPKGDGGREINDLHHAKDAYITTFMGEYLLKNFSLDNVEELKLSGLHYAKPVSDDEKNRRENGYILYSMRQKQELDNKNFTELSEAEKMDRLWDSRGDSGLTVAQALANFDRNYYAADCFVSLKIDSKTQGAFYEQTRYKSEKNLQKFGNLNKDGKNFKRLAGYELGTLKKPLSILGKKVEARAPVLDVKRYGGYTAQNFGFFALVEYDDEKGQLVRELKGCPYMVLINSKNGDKHEIEELLLAHWNAERKRESGKNYVNLKICRFMPKKTLLQNDELGKVYLNGKTDITVAVPFVIPRDKKELNNLIYLMFKTKSIYTAVTDDKKGVIYTDYLSWGNWGISNVESYIEKQFANFKDLCLDYLEKKYKKPITLKSVEAAFVAVENIPQNDDMYCGIPKIKNSIMQKLLLIEQLLKILNGNLGNLNIFDKSLKNYVGRNSLSRKNDWENTYIIHRSITGVFSCKEKVLNN